MVRGATYRLTTIEAGPRCVAHALLPSGSHHRWRHAAMTSILGLDLGKFKSVTCSYDTNTTNSSFAALHTDPIEFRRSAQRVAVVPRHPTLRACGEHLGVLLQFGQVV